MFVVRGRPPGLAGGMSGSSGRNERLQQAELIVRQAWPEPKSPTSARSAGVHMAVSKQETAYNAAQQARINPSNQPHHPFANGHLGTTRPAGRLREAEPSWPVSSEALTVCAAISCVCGLS